MIEGDRDVVCISYHAFKSLIETAGRLGKIIQIISSTPPTSLPLLPSDFCYNVLTVYSFFTSRTDSVDVGLGFVLVDEGVSLLGLIKGELSLVM